MAEVIGLVASLITVAGVGAKLANKLFKIGDRAIEADHQINKVAINISMFSSTLKHFAMVAQQNQDLLSIEGSEIATLLMEQCKGIFEDFTQMAVSAKDSCSDPANIKSGRMPSRQEIIKKIKAFFQAPKVNTLLAELEYLKSTLTLLIGTLTLAVTTAHAREMSIKSNNLEQTMETNTRLQNERIHVETLIMSRQMTMNILIAKGADEVNHDSQLSPTASEDSFEDVKHPHPLLLQPAPSTSLMRLGDPKNNYLHRAFPPASIQPQKELDEEDLRPIISTSHSQIIDQLLGRWTRLDEVESEMQHPESSSSGDTSGMNGKAGKNGDSKTNSRDDSLLGSPVAISPPELTLSRVESPDQITPTPSNHNGTSTINGQLSDRRGSSLSSAIPLPPPPRNTRNLTMNSKLTPGPHVPSYHRSMSTSGIDRVQQVPFRPVSPQPQPANAMTIPNRNVDIVSSSRRHRYNNYSPNVSPTGSWQPAAPVRRPRWRNWHQPEVADSDPEQGTDDSVDEEARLGLGVEWTIRSGGRYWEILDGKIIGPRTPFMPTETMEQLYAKADATTDIDQSWIRMEALSEGKWPYRLERIQNEYMPSNSVEQKKIVFARAMQHAEIQQLVNRSAEIYEAKRRARESAPPVQPSARRSSMKSQRPPNIVTQGYAQPGSSYPTSVTPRDRDAPGAEYARMNARRQAPPYQPGQVPPYPIDHRPSYHGPSGDRPTTAGSTESRGSTDLSGMNDRSVHFTPSVQGDTPPRTPREGGSRSRYDENNFYYDKRAEDRERLREAQRRRHDRKDRDFDHSDISSDERKKDKKHRSSRAVKVGASMAGIAGLLETLDSIF